MQGMTVPTYVVNVEGAVVEDGEFLLIERAASEDHAAGTLGFPGGKIEVAPGHSAPIESTARRELEEEVGIVVEGVEYVCSRSFRAEGGAKCLNIITSCDRVSGEPSPADPDEVASVRWLSPTDIRAHPKAPQYLERDVEAIQSFHER